MIKSLRALIGAAAATVLSAGMALGMEITGAGSTFVFPVVAKWAAVYKAQSGDNLNYQSIGSGGGIAQIKAKTVTFGATDKPLAGKELAAAGLIQFPVVIGGIVPIVNIRGLGAGKLVLNGPTLVAIFQGRIKRWNAPEIQKLNPGLKLPGQAIAVIHRSDGSGTTYQFTTYLARISKDWADNVGADTAINWPTGIGAKGNEGVAGNVAHINGAIGYVEYTYARQNHLSYTRMINKDGKAVDAAPASFKAAAANADWTAAAKNNFAVLFLNDPGANTWPITATTFVVMYKKPANQAASAAALKFFKWGMEKGDELALGLDYVPLPANAVSAIEASWKGVAGSGL